MRSILSKIIKVIEFFQINITEEYYVNLHSKDQFKIYEEKLEELELDNANTDIR